MKKSLLIALMAVMVAAPAFAEEAAAPAAPAAVVETAAAAPAAAPLTIERRQIISDFAGARVGLVASIGADGSPVVIYRGRFVTVPLASISLADGELKSSLTRAEILAAN